MSLLAIDTTGPDCAAIIADADGRRLAGRRLSIGRGHAERLAPLVAELLDESGLTASDLDRIGVAVGPGSFAGTRVGVAFARGLALSARARAYGISNLEVLAHQGPPRVWVVHDAKRGEVIAQAWQDGKPLDEPQRLTVEDALQAWAGLRSGGYALAGSGAGLIDDTLTTVSGALDDDVLAERTRLATSEMSPPTPFYARPPDAKLPGGVAP